LNLPYLWRNLMQRGRKSAESLAIAPVMNGSSRPLPEGLSEAELAVFRSIKAAVPVDHFQASDEPLLIEYCTAVVQARRAAAMLRRDGDVTDKGRPSGWVTVQEKAQRSMISLSLRLRLSPQARREKVKTERPISWSERFSQREQEYGL
jgi:phage terminase small subunit